MTQETGISAEMRQALSRFGPSDRKLDKLNGNTLLVKDLDIWGDDFGDLYEILSDVYGTNNKIDAKYIPSEFAWQRQPILWIPFVPFNKYLKCEPLSLSELDKFMRA